MKTLLSKWTLISMFKGVDWFNIMKSPVADLHSKILDAPPSRSNFIHFYAVFKFYFTKQNCIPVGCILPALHRVCVWRAGLYLGGLDSKPPNKNPLSETPRTETPLDRTTLDRDPLHRDPPGQRPPGQRPPGQRPHSEGSWNQKKRPPWKENGTRQPDRKCYHTEPPPTVNRMTHTSENITLPLAILPFADGNNRLATPFEVGAHSGKPWTHPWSTSQNGWFCVSFPSVRSFAIIGYMPTICMKVTCQILLNLEGVA